MADVPLTLAGRYRLDQIIGRGGMAEVWQGRDLLLGRDVAIKRLRADLATDPTFQARFQREAHSAAGLNHPNIVAVYDTGSQIDNATGVAVPYIVMELVHGRTLRDLLADGSTITPASALTYTEGVLDALAYSHQRGIVHRDIKPANVMLTTAGSIKVMDFGIARAVSDTSATMTQTAAVIGTAQYLSPEQARGETVDARSDVYSTGCLLYELLTHRPPFIGDSPVSVAYQHVREMPIPPSQLNSAITPAIDAIVMQSLAKNPADRYQGAQDMRDDIARGLAGQQVQAAVPVVPVDTALVAPPARAAAPVVAAPPPPPPVAGAAPTVALTRQTGPLPMVEDEYDEDDEDEGPSRGGLSAVAIALIVVVGAILITAGIVVASLLKGSTNQVTLYTVPDVIGYDEETAKDAITKNLLTAGVVHLGVNDDENDECTLAQKDKVVRQNPIAGEKLEGGTKVTITVCQGPEVLVIPTTLFGMSEIDAVNKLKELGFNGTWGTPVQASPADEKPELLAGQVAATSPKMGETVSVTGKITLTIATGKSLLPSVQGETESAARSILAEKGFTKVSVQDAPAAEVQAGTKVGTVVNQDPEADQAVLRSQEIVIYIARNITMPNLKGMTVEEARTALSQLGWTGPHEPEWLSPWDEPKELKAGEIYATTPPEGSTFLPNDRVVFIVATGKSAVPDLVGMSEDEAKKALTDRGLVPEVQSAGYSDTYAKGVVAAQSIEWGQELTRPATVTIYVSEGPEPAPPPPTSTPPEPPPGEEEPG